MWDPSHYFTIPLDSWIQDIVMNWLVPEFRPFFRVIQWPVAKVLAGLSMLLQVVPFPIFLLGASAIAWRTAGWRVSVFTGTAIILLNLLGLWDDSMTTLAMIFTAVAFCAGFGIPIGILAARHRRFSTTLRPILDIMQTVPSFVYLVPIVMLFGVGLVPGTVATIVFGIPPIIRLTELGIRQVQPDLVEAARSFGSTSFQVLWEVELPLARPSIMAGLNQTLMMALSMVVIAALIGAGGLGVTVYTGIGRLDVGTASLGGIGIVLLAIILDRITQSVARPSLRKSNVRTGQKTHSNTA